MRKFIVAAIVMLAGFLSLVQGQILGPIIGGSNPTFPSSNLQYHWTAASFAGTADGTAISSWTDTVGGQAATQSTGANQCTYKTSITVSGKPAVFCQYLVNGSATSFTNQFFNLPGTVSVTQANTAVFWIGEWGYPYGDSYPTIIDFGTGTSFTGWTLFGTQPPFTGSVAQGIGWAGNGGFGNLGGSLPFPVGPYALLAGTKTTGASVVAEGFTGTRSVTLSAGTTITGGTIGNWPGQSTISYADMAIYEIFVYSAYPSAAQIAQLQNYASTKYGAAVSTRTHNVVCLGDSITAGLGSNNLQSWPYKMARAGNLWQTAAIRNLGVSGVSLAGVVPSETHVLPGAYNAAFARNVLVIWLGTNDTRISGQTDVQVIANMKTIGQYAKGLGYKVVWVTILPRAGNTTQENTYNTNINAYLQGTNGSVITDGAGDSVVDLTTNSNLYPLANYQACCTSDGGTHPNDTGYAIIAPLISAAVTALF